MENTARKEIAFSSEVSELLPHSGEMVFIEEILGVSDTGLECRVLPNASHLRLAGYSSPIAQDVVPAWIGIEYLSQAAAAFSASSAGAQTEAGGLVLSLRRFECSESYFRLGEALLLTVELEASAGASAVFSGEIFCGERVLVSAQLHLHRGLPTEVQDG